MDFVLQDWFSRVQRLYVYASAREWEHIYYGIPLMQHIIYDWLYFWFIVEGKGDSGIKRSPLSHPKLRRAKNIIEEVPITCGYLSY